MNSPSLIAVRRTTTVDVKDDDRERQLAVALEVYAAELDRGDPACKDELLAKYPEIADELAGCLDSLDFIHQVAPQFHDDLALSRSCTTADIRSLAALGDFRIIREIGRGGMGVVYEAEQLSLGRRVALKVLPFAAMLDKQQLKRFKNEARAAATLDHPNIVAIYSVGEERGVHYYAMQLVEGYNLAQIIAEVHAENAPIASDGSAMSGIRCDSDTVAALSTLRTSRPQEFFRSIARLGIQAAEALDFAHRQGIIHRDIKPANLLLDGLGHLRVADFGLARIDADAKLTMTGDLLGTLRYMSPEQSSGQYSLVDHRTDIYSLGVTLYELLAGRPAFDQTDHRALLKSIAEVDPPKLHKLVPMIPVDLSTVVHNAIEKLAADRYPAAQALADDLKSLVDGRPISACPPDLRQRFVRWLRRNPAVAAATVLVMGTLLIITAIAAILIGGAWKDAQESSRKAAVQRDRYLGERNQALRNLYLADIQLAQRAWEEGHLEPFDKLLDAQKPNVGQPDLRAWEWYYLKSLGHREVATLNGHASDVACVEWSPNGRLLASSGADFTIRIWDGVTWKQHATLLGHSAEVESVAWSPDGTRLASSAWDNTLRVWDPATGNSLLSIPTDFGWMTRNVVWSPDGTRLASCGTSGPSPEVGEGDVKIWDARTGQALLRMKGPSSLVLAVAWSPDGKLLASTGNYDCPDVRIWDANTGQLVQQIDNASDGPAVTSVAWNSDNTRLAATVQDFVKVWDISTGEIQWQAQAHPGGAVQVRWCPDGNMLASVGCDGTLKLWNDHGVLDATYRGHRSMVTSFDWRSDGRRIASASLDRTVRIWDPTLDQEATVIDAFSIARWYPDEGHTLAIVNESDADESLRLQFLSAGSWSAAQEMPFPVSKKSINSPGRVELAWSPDSNLVAVGYPTKDAAIVTVTEASTGAHVGTMKEAWSNGPNPIREMAWSPVAPLIAIAKGGDGTVVRNVSSLKKVAELQKGEGIDSVAWSPDGRRLAVSAWDQTLSVYDSANWRRIVRLNRHPDVWERSYGGRHMAAWSPGGHVLAAGTARGWVIMWDTHSWRELLSFSADTASIRSLAFSHDGRRLATASASGVVRIWDVDSGENLLTLHDDTERLDYISWSPDGTCLLTSSNSHHRIWDASSEISGSGDQERESAALVPRAATR